MLLFAATHQTKLVVCVSCSRSHDGSHEHVVEMTVRSVTGHEQRLSVPDAVAQLSHPLGERYVARIPTGGHVELMADQCPFCHERPHVRLSKGGRIEDLPRCH